MLRDSTACLFLFELIKLKYNFGGILYNIPSDIFFPKMKTSDLLSSPLPNLSNKDIILHLTRPALNDDKKNDRRWLFKSDLELENVIFQNMRKFFIYCNRQRVILSNEMSNYSPPSRQGRVSLPSLSQVGSRTGEVQCPLPIPATSNAACGFPALRFPINFF
ncbi:hypothetical protein [Candidatus Scalindua japonica]|uniref:hypothetical protein n=1 Tax=Candidatus Scalindua japonica TaxID=1284222 RepID=UPI000BDE6873|nr:hypothetical protein [Candidatus Scalindua japonica]